MTEACSALWMILATIFGLTQRGLEFQRNKPHVSGHHTSQETRSQYLCIGTVLGKGKKRGGKAGRIDGFAASSTWEATDCPEGQSYRPCCRRHKRCVLPGDWCWSSRWGKSPKGRSETASWRPRSGISPVPLPLHEGSTQRILVNTYLPL